MTAPAEPHLLDALGRTVDEGGFRGRVGLLPLGSVEYHGPHSPLGTDVFIARELAGRIARARPELLLLPELAYTACPVETREYPGTISIEPSLAAKLLEGIFRSLFRSGLAGVVVVNAHSGNVTPLALAGDGVGDDFPDAFVAAVNWWETVPGEETGPLGNFSQDGGHGHGGPVEMSVTAAIRPDLVRPEWANDVDVVEKRACDALRVVSDPRRFVDFPGYHGRVREIDAGTGARLLELAATRIVASIDDLLAAAASRTIDHSGLPTRSPLASRRR